MLRVRKNSKKQSSPTATWKKNLTQKTDIINQRNVELDNLKSQKNGLQNQLDETMKSQLRLSNELANKSNRLEEITDQFLGNEAKIGLLEIEVSEKNKKIALIDDQLQAACLAPYIRPRLNSKVV